MDLLILLLYIGGMYWAIRSLTAYIFRDVDKDE